jgi:signal transduction histidine kinase
MLDMFREPAALLDPGGSILAVNRAWSDQGEAFPDEAHAYGPGDHYLEACRSACADVPGIVRQGVGLVLSGRRSSYDGCCGSEGGRAFRVRIRRIDDSSARFTVTHEVARREVSAEDVEARVLTAQVQERERLGADLHDCVGQTLVCIGLQVARLRRAAADGGEVAAIIEEMADSVHEAHAEIRTLSFLLQPPWLEEAGGLEAALREFVEGFARRAGLQAKVELVGAPFSLPRRLELGLFRILQEALVNVHRHARAEAVGVRLARGARHLTLSVRDDGYGMAVGQGVRPSPGVGILSMRARLREFGGDLAFISGPGGTTLVAKLPIPAPDRSPT